MIFVKFYTGKELERDFMNIFSQYCEKEKLQLTIYEDIVRNYFMTTIPFYIWQFAYRFSNKS